MQINYDLHSDSSFPAPSLGEARSAVGEIDAHPHYFSAASRRTTLDMALYLARYSDLVLLLHGPTGSGKSSLLREMIARGGPNIHAITVAADSALSTQAICDSVLTSFKLITAQSTQNALAEIKEQLDLLQRKGYHCIVFIDDADRLPNDAYPFLEALADLRGDSGRNLLNLVLFAQLREKISFPGPSVRHRVKATELQPLSVDEVAGFIQHVQHNRRGVEFNTREIQRIARASSGWPGNINALIAQRSARYAGRPNSASSLLDHHWITPRYLLAATALTTAAILIFVFQDSVNQLFEVPPINSPTVTVQPQAPTPTQVVAAAQLAAPLPVNPATTTPPEVIPAAPEPEATLIARELPANPPAAAKPAETTQVTTAKPQRHDWLLAQNPDAYTLQIAGSSQEGDIRRALKKFNLTDPAAVFSASRKGKPWFGLVTGVYADFASAKQARAALPEELMRGAWVRRLSAVQNEINKPQDATESAEQTTGTAAATSQPTAPPTQVP